MPQTFEEFISSDLDDLYAAALCFTQDEHFAEELLQEASIRAFHEFRGPTRNPDFKGWMLGVLVNTYLLRERRAGADPFQAELPPFGNEAEEGRDPPRPFPREGTRAYEFLRAWLDGAWHELDAGDRVVLWLAAITRLRHPRVAAILGLDEQQVRRRHYRARRTLSVGAANHIKRRMPGSAEA